MVRFKTNLQRVLNLMLDGKWHTADEIREVGGSEGLRRLRELKSPCFGEMSYEEKEIKNGLYQYRLLLETVDKGTAEKILAGKLKYRPVTKPVPSSEYLIRADMHAMVDQFSNGKELRAAYRAMKRCLSLDPDASATPVLRIRREIELPA